MTSSWAVEVRRSTADWASERIAHDGQPFVGGSVGGQHGGGLVVAGDDEDEKPIELIGNGTSLINGTADIKINGQTIWKDAHISVMIANSRTFILDPNDRDTDNHFGDQSVYGIVTRLIV